MIVTQHPDFYHNCFNPCIIKATKGDEDRAIIKICPGSLSYISENFVKVEREYFNGKAVFDIRKIIQNFMQPGITFLDEIPCWTDSMFVFHYTVFDNDGTYIYGAMATNAVAQIQETSNLNDNQGHVITKFDRLKRYAGYPLEIVVYSFLGADTFIRFDGEAFVGPMSAFVFVLPITDAHNSIEIGNQDFDCYLRDNEGNIIKDSSGNYITDVVVDSDYRQNMMPIENPIMPENPFYIRWINRQGGYDYWMFSYRQYLTRSISNQQTFNPYVENQETSDSFEELYDLSANESVRVGTEGLNANDYDCVSKLIYSPKIEHYNPETMKWTRIFVEKGDNELDTRSILNQLEFTFKLPTVQLQF